MPAELENESYLASEELASRDEEDEPDFSLDLSRVKPNGIRTVGDAFSLCEQLITAQVDKAVQHRAELNTPITGDSAARAAFLLLLPDEQKRQLFLKTVRRSEAWSRIRSLFGSPPFAFLHPNDTGMLRAGGIGVGRVNMVYQKAGLTSGIGQFGPGQLKDEHSREYRLAPRNSRMQDPLPGGDFFELVDGEVLMQVKIQKRSKAEKQRILKSVKKRQLFFPQPGERIRLEETKTLMRARGLRVSTQTSLVVKALLPRGEGASTAAILCKVC